jgi:hypothetical protein
VQRHIAPKFTRDPLAHRAQLGIGVVLGRDQQRRDLGPALGLVYQVLQRIEYGSQVRTGEPEVELLGECLQIDIGRIHFRVELAPRFRVDVTGRDGHGLEAVRVAGIRRVERVLGEDHRIVVGECHAPAAGCQRGLCNRVGTRLVHQPVHFGRFGDVPVLAELAGKVAAGGAEGKHGRARMEVIERLLFDRIDAESRGATIGREDHRFAFALAHKTQPALAVVQPAVARAQVALDAAVVEPVPPACREMFVRRRCRHEARDRVRHAACPSVNSFSVNSFSVNFSTV